MRQWKVGTISMGLLLIILGLLLLGNTIWDIAITDFITYAWPIILILLGLEVLIYSFFKKDGPLKFDFFSILILILALMFTFVVYSVQETGIISAVRNTINDERYTLNINQSLDLPENIDEVIIDAPNGNFNITGKETEKAEIMGTIQIGANSKEEAEKYLDEVLTVKIVGNQAIIRIEDSKRLNLIGTNPLKADLNISLPKDLLIKPNLINGDITLSNMNGSGNIEGVNGRIKLENCSGNYEVKTVNGELIFKNIFGDIKGKTVNGEIKAEEVTGALVLETTNGEIDVISSSVQGNWEIDTVNGEIELSIPNTADAKVTAKSSIGEVDGNLPWVDKNPNTSGINLSDHKEAILGEGKYTIDLNSQHGEIEVNTK